MLPLLFWTAIAIANTTSRIKDAIDTLRHNSPPIVKTSLGKETSLNHNFHLGPWYPSIAADFCIAQDDKFAITKASANPMNIKISVFVHNIIDS